LHHWPGNVGENQQRLGVLECHGLGNFWKKSLLVHVWLSNLSRASLVMLPWKWQGPQFLIVGAFHFCLLCVRHVVVHLGAFLGRPKWRKGEGKPRSNFQS